MCLLQTPSTFLVATIIASVGPLLTRGEYVDANNPIARKDFQEFPLKATGRLCEGGHRCSAPKECCALGCCYLYAPPSPPKTPASPVTDHVLNLFLVNHWYFWWVSIIVEEEKEEESRSIVERVKNSWTEKLWNLKNPFVNMFRFVSFHSVFQVRYPRHSPCATLFVHVVAQATSALRLGLGRRWPWHQRAPLGGRFGGQLLLTATVQSLQFLSPRTATVYWGNFHTVMESGKGWKRG